MRHLWLLVILLVVATLLVDLAVVSAAATHPFLPFGWLHPALAALFALGFAQVGLVAVWTGFGGKSLPWRILALVLIVGLWSRLLAWFIAERDHVSTATTNWICALLAQTAVILVPLWAVRFRGVRLIRAEAANPSAAIANCRGPLQFSLRYLLSWITVLAVVLGLAQYTVEFEELAEALIHGWRELGVFSLGHGGLVLAGFWAVLGTKRLGVRCLVAVATTAATIAVNHLWTGIEELWLYSGLCVLQLLWVVGSLWVFRVAGYRMTRMRRAPQVQAEEPAVSPDAG
jgi:hypothetical protein